MPAWILTALLPSLTLPCTMVHGDSGHLGRLYLEVSVQPSKYGRDEISEGKQKKHKKTPTPQKEKTPPCCSMPAAKSGQVNPCLWTSGHHSLSALEIPTGTEGSSGLIVLCLSWCEKLLFCVVLIFPWKVSVPPLLPLHCSKLHFYLLVECEGPYVAVSVTDPPSPPCFACTKSQRNIPVIRIASLLIPPWGHLFSPSAIWPHVPTCATCWKPRAPPDPQCCSLAAPVGTAELSSHQSITHVPLGPLRFANLSVELVIDKLRQSPFFTFYPHPSFPSRAASLFLPQKLLLSCCWSRCSVPLQFWVGFWDGLAKSGEPPLWIRPISSLMFYSFVRLLFEYIWWEVTWWDRSKKSISKLAQVQRWCSNMN